MSELLGRPEVALLVGVVLSLGALGFVLLPIFAAGEPESLRAPRRRAPAGGAEHEATAIAALREIEFDRVTGKLSDDDYAALKATYTEEALAAMRATGAGAAQVAGSAPPDIDPVEAAILASRARESCAVCGPRPEPDAVYCSDCGRYLRGRCGDCGTVVDQPGAQFCAACGSTLAA